MGYGTEICAREGCGISFEKATHNQRYHNLSCKRIVDSERKRQQRLEDNRIREVVAGVITSKDMGVSKAPSEPSKKFEYTINPATGEGTASYVFGPDERDRSFDDVLQEMLPEVPCEILEVYEMTAWGDPENPRKSIKTRVRRAESPELASSRKQLFEFIRSREPRIENDEPLKGESATFVVCPADTQIGKYEPKVGGTKETVERCMEYIGKVQDRWSQLKRAGIPLNDVLMVGMGDTTEAVSGHYPNQTFTVDCNESEQIEVAEFIHDQWIDAWSNMAGVETFETMTINSNHDRPRQGNKYITDSSDSRAFMIWRSLARAYGKNPDRYGHVRFTLPEDPLVGAVERHGHGIAFIHGDQATKGSVPSDKVWRWWDKQIAGGPHKCVSARCDILVAAHYHHYYALRQQGRTMFGCPSLDNGSQWLTDSEGIWSDPGLLTFVVDESGANHELVLT